MKLVKFMGWVALGQEAPLSTWGVSSDVLKGLPTLLHPLQCPGVSQGQAAVTTGLITTPPTPLGRCVGHLRLTSARYPAHVSPVRDNMPL